MQFVTSEIVVDVRPSRSRFRTMPVNLSNKNAADEVVERLRRRAERNHRSLQGEMLAILEDAVRPERSLSPGELLAEVRRLGLGGPAEAADIVRSDRDGR